MIRRRCAPSCIAALALLAASVAYPRDARAGWPEERHRVLPCRPTVSCTADLVPPGSLEVEAGYAGRRSPPAGFVNAEPVLVKLTLATWVQAQIGMNGEVFSTGDVARSLRYLDDISVGPKFHLLDQATEGLLPSLAVSATVQVPSWDRPRQFAYAYDAELWGYVSKDLGPLHLDLNGGVNVLEFDYDAHAQPFVSLASSYGFLRYFGALLEVYDFAAGGPVAPHDAGVLSGLTVSPWPWLMLDAGADVGLVPSVRKYTLFAGVTTVLYDFWDTDAERQAAE